ncbi:MAG TPA: carotenoid biosynthesis protein, partial [Caldimonas sp.]|nr:carotenoid biosynthesis protein [Caldimonas sp.]
MRDDAGVRPASRWAWILVWLMAAFTVVTSIWTSLIPGGLVGIINTILLVAFALVHGISVYGGRTMLWFIVVCLVVSNVAENSSIVTGFPFGHYHYTDILGQKLFL